MNTESHKQTEKTSVTVWRESLYEALFKAIEVQEKLESGYGYILPSAKLATWREMLRVTKDGGMIFFHDRGPIQY